MVEGQQPGHEIGVLFHAVRRAAREVRVGSLLAPRLHDVIVLANREVPWDQFRERVVTEIHGGRCRIGVGGRCGERIEFPHSYWQAELALRIQKAVRGPERATLFDGLGVYQVLATAGDASAIEHFVTEWLAR